MPISGTKYGSENIGSNPPPFPCVFFLLISVRYAYIYIYNVYIKATAGAMYSLNNLVASYIMLIIKYYYTIYRLLDDELKERNIPWSN